MGWLSKIFGNEKQLDKLTTGAVSGLDKMFFTKEEKADANQKLSEWYLRYLEATQPQNVARRVIAFIVVGLWALLVLVGVAAQLFDAPYAKYVFEVLAEVVMNPFLLIVGFYFLTHTVRAYKKD